MAKSNSFFNTGYRVAIEGAILCTLALPGQFEYGETFAALANLAIITTLIAAAALILRHSK